MKSRESILNRITSALKIHSQIPSAEIDHEKDFQKELDMVTPKNNNGLWLQFKNELEAVAGEFYSVKNIDEAAEVIYKFISETKYDRVGISKENICREVAEKIRAVIPSLKIILPEDLNYQERKIEFSTTEVAIVNASFAVADIGSLVFTYDKAGTSYPHFLCDNTFVIVNENQIAANQFELFNKLDDKESKNMVFVTGQSRTADIEKVLVLGAHGPRRLVVLKF